MFLEFDKRKVETGSKRGRNGTDQTQPGVQMPTRLQTEEPLTSSRSIDGGISSVTKRIVYIHCVFLRPVRSAHPHESD